MTKKLWLTYAWVDNEDADVDFVAERIRSHGVEVWLDRTRIVAGRRLWQQIDQLIQSPELDGFAIYATEHSLRSEPCQEELAIALDRVLRQKGSQFSLIGIFPVPVDHELIPSSIATRLFVSLKDENWSARVAGACPKKRTQRSVLQRHTISTSTSWGQIRIRDAAERRCLAPCFRDGAIRS